MDIRELTKEIENLRIKLTNEFERSLEMGDEVSQRIIELSRQLDKLIVEYIKMNNSKK